MHESHPSDLVRALARQLHRDAASASLRVALPVLRRILATHTLRGFTLPQLHKQRELVQRKHLLRMLAIEAGFNSWEHYSQALPGMTVAQLSHLDLLRPSLGYPNLWFSTLDEAQAHLDAQEALPGEAASTDQLRVLKVGAQAVLVRLHEPSAQAHAPG